MRRQLNLSNNFELKGDIGPHKNSPNISSRFRSSRSDSKSTLSIYFHDPRFTYTIHDLLSRSTIHLHDPRFTIYDHDNVFTIHDPDPNLHQPCDRESHDPRFTIHDPMVDLVPSPTSQLCQLQYRRETQMVNKKGHHDRC